MLRGQKTRATAPQELRPIVKQIREPPGRLSLHALAAAWATRIREPPGSARFHLLPPRPHESGSHRLELPDSSYFCDLRIVPHKAFLSTTIGRHRLKRPKSANLPCSAHFPVPRLKGEVGLSKNSGELERAAALSNFQSRPAACTVGAGRFLLWKIPFSRAKIVSLQFLRPEIS